MRSKKPQPQGWLRVVIASALDQVAQKSYISQVLKQELKDTAEVIDKSERLRRASHEHSAA